MSMPGGGSWDIAPGQVTDDSELAMCLMHALVEGKGKIDAKAIVKNYGLWYQSDPFAVGSTTANAMEQADPKDPDPEAMRAVAQ